MRQQQRNRQQGPQRVVHRICVTVCLLVHHTTSACECASCLLSSFSLAPSPPLRAPRPSGAAGHRLRTSHQRTAHANMRNAYRSNWVALAQLREAEAAAGTAPTAQRCGIHAGPMRARLLPAVTPL